MRLSRALFMAFVVSAVTLGTVGVSFAQTPFSANYDFAGSQGNQASNAITANPTGAIFSVFTRGNGITAASAQNSISSTGFVANGTLSDAITNNQYYTFSVTPSSGSTVSLTGFTFTPQRSGTGSTNLVIRSSRDGFTTDLAATVVSNPGISVTLAPTNSANLTAATEYRLYGFGGTATGGTLRIGTTATPQFVINGSIAGASVVPEAGTLGLIAFALPAIGAVIARRRK